MDGGIGKGSGGREGVAAESGDDDLVGICHLI